jgi:hypothetical protein
VLVRYDEAEGAWFRLEPRSAVIAGQRLLALPEFRPGISLISGLDMDLSGGTKIVLRAGDEVEATAPPAADANVPVVEVLYGRVILINKSMTDGVVRLKLGPHTASARLARAARLGVELKPQYVAGNDPQKTAAPIVLALYAPDGGVNWQDAHGEIMVDAPSRWLLAPKAPPEIVADSAPPAWLDAEPEGQRSEQKFAAPRIDGSMVSDRPAEVQLLEMFHGNAQRELKSLTAKSCIHLGQFDPTLDVLRDAAQRANWKSHIEAIRAAMAVSPESAAAVSKALVDQRGRQAAADLYEMLCGYNLAQIGGTPDEMKAGAVARLIDWLEEDSLDYRVLAVENLAEITGKRLMSNPAANATDRKINVRNWRKRLEEGDLRPLEQPR